MTLSMEATKLRDDKEIDKNNIFEIGKYRLLRNAAIYGHNASGKSNLVDAMMFMRNFVRTSTDLTAKDASIGVEQFALDKEALEEPSFFQIIFLLEERRYRYGFELDEHRIRSEWLYRKIDRETPLFIREYDDFNVSGSFKKETFEIKERTRENALFLSTLAQWNSPTATVLLEWFTKMFGVISGLNDTVYREYTLYNFEKTLV